MRVFALAAFAAFALLPGALLPLPARADQQQWEQRTGQQEYRRLQKHGEIVTDSPYYRVLDPIAAPIAAVADRKYGFPFHFILVREDEPNAFAVPGGNVYVTTALMEFVKTREELAGVLCHEVSHDIHHDVYDLAIKDEVLDDGAALLEILTKNAWARGAIAAGAGLYTLHFSRVVEANADRTGAYICAQAGMNPWGMVWLFERFETRPSGVPLEFLSDHPRDDHRVRSLEKLFSTDAATFGGFNANPSSATPLEP